MVSFHTLPLPEGGYVARLGCGCEGIYGTDGQLLLELRCDDHPAYYEA